MNIVGRGTAIVRGRPRNGLSHEDLPPPPPQLFETLATEAEGDGEDNDRTEVRQPVSRWGRDDGLGRGRGGSNIRPDSISAVAAGRGRSSQYIVKDKVSQRDSQKEKEREVDRSRGRGSIIDNKSKSNGESEVRGDRVRGTQKVQSDKARQRYQVKVQGHLAPHSSPVPSSSAGRFFESEIDREVDSERETGGGRGTGRGRGSVDDRNLEDTQIGASIVYRNISEGKEDMESESERPTSIRRPVSLSRGKEGSIVINDRDSMESERRTSRPTSMRRPVSLSRGKEGSIVINHRDSKDSDSDFDSNRRTDRSDGRGRGGSNAHDGDLNNESICHTTRTGSTALEGSYVPHDRLLADNGHGPRTMLSLDDLQQYDDDLDGSDCDEDYSSDGDKDSTMNTKSENTDNTESSMDGDGTVSEKFAAMELELARSQRNSMRVSMRVLGEQAAEEKQIDDMKSSIFHSSASDVVSRVLSLSTEKVLGESRRSPVSSDKSKDALYGEQERTMRRSLSLAEALSKEAAIASTLHREKRGVGIRAGPGSVKKSNEGVGNLWNDVWSSDSDGGHHNETVRTYANTASTTPRRPANSIQSPISPSGSEKNHDESNTNSYGPEDGIGVGGEMLTRSDDGDFNAETEETSVGNIEVGGGIIIC